MKKLFLLLVSPFALWIGLTLFFSYKTEHVFNVILEASQHKLVDGLSIIESVETLSYERGLFNSQGKSLVQLNINSSGSDKTLALHFEHNIYHGPVMNTPDGVKIGISYIVTTLNRDLLSITDREFIDLIFNGVATPFISTQYIGINERTITTTEIAPISFNADLIDKGGDKFGFTIAGLSSRLLKTKSSKAEGFINIGHLTLDSTFKGRPFNLIMSPLSVNFARKKSYKDIALAGNITINLRDILLSGQDNGLLLNEILIKLLLEDENPYIASSNIIQVDKVSLSGVDFKTKIPAAELDIRLGIEGLEREVIKGAINEYHDTLATHNPTEQGGYLSIIKALFQKRLEINSEIDINNSKGHAFAKVHLSYLAQDKQNTIKELVEPLKAQFNLSIDKDLVRHTSAVKPILLLQRLGFLLQNETAFGSLILLDNGHLNINGQKSIKFEQYLSP